MREISRIAASLFILVLLVDVAGMSRAYAYKCPPDCKAKRANRDAEPAPPSRPAPPAPPNAPK